MKPYLCGDEKAVYIPPSASGDVHSICMERLDSDEFAAVYALTIDGLPMGDLIEIPKDLAVQSGEVKYVTVADEPYSGATVGDAYLSLSVQNDGTVYVPLPSATVNQMGLMTSADKTKLNGIPSNAQANQNAFGKVAVGSSTIEAENQTDTLTLVAGTNITLTPNSSNDTIMISASSSPPSDAFPVGSVYVTTTDTAPDVGGTWEMIDAQFADFYHESTTNDQYVTFSSTYADPNSEQHVYQQLCGHNWYIRAVLTLTGTLDENECPLFTLNQMPGSLAQNVAATLFNDTANGYAYGGLTNNGVMRTLEVLTRNGTAVAGTMSGGHLYMNMCIPFSFKQTNMMNTMALNWCDKFYWKRIS